MRTKSQTVQRMNEWIVASCLLKIRGGREIDSKGNKAGKGPLVRWEQSMTIGVSQDQTLFVWKETDQDHHTVDPDIP